MHLRKKQAGCKKITFKTQFTNCKSNNYEKKLNTGAANQPDSFTTLKKIAACASSTGPAHLLPGSI